jgi:hypothetical protein
MSNAPRPGTEFEHNIDKVGQHIAKNILDVIKTKIKKVFKNESGKPE